MTRDPTATRDQTREEPVTQEETKVGARLSAASQVPPCMLTTLRDIGRAPGQLVHLDPERFMPLPYPYNTPESHRPLKPLTESAQQNLECDLDGTSAIQIPRPKSRQEEEELIAKFLSGLRKLFSIDSNWTFLGPLLLRMDCCAKCQNCSEACPVYVASGRQEIYRPTYRSEVFRRIVKKYVMPGGFMSGFTAGDIDLNWRTIARLGELAYRCTLCRRCAKFCPIGIGNAMVSREIRKVFSQEMGIAPAELHRLGSMQHLKVGSSTGMTPAAFTDTMEFMEEDTEERTGMSFKWPIDKAGADILLIHNAGEFLSWPENAEAFAVILEAAGVSYTLSSDLLGYDAVNYGLWYDDVQLARVVLKHIEVAKKLGVKKIVVGECGHAHKALMVIADRILTGEMNIPRESCFVTLQNIIDSGRLKLDPDRNNFPVTLHDPCNVVRLMGIIEPQRRVLRKIAPQFREMYPNRTENYCCGGGSGFAIFQGLNFPDWRSAISGRMKFKQILEAFQDTNLEDPASPKYVCAPCSNCKGGIRGTFDYFDATNRSGLQYGGLVELIVNAMVDVPKPFMEWQQA
jgi:Fe-S oxidoreductase